MLFDQIRAFLAHYVDLTPAETRAIESRLIFREVPARHRLLELGAVSQEVFFINRGAVRFYYLTEEGKDVTGFIFLENMFSGAHTSFFYQRPSHQIVETIEPSELLVLPYTDLQLLYTEVPKMHAFMERLLAERLSFAQEVLASFVLNKPEARYRALLARRPELLGRVPQHILSSYLGITPVSLSRIRKRLSEEGKL
ncbi:MAG: Crp/Fnr family transcriptional regulator [Bacteroidota bacterium]